MEVEFHIVELLDEEWNPGSEHPMTTRPTTGTQAVDRAALLIATVVRADEPLTFADLQEACGLPKSTTSRMLTALERTELLERNDAGSYVAGPLFWLYATRHDPWEELVRLARPTMEKVGQDTGETVNLSVCRGDRVVQVAQVDSTYLLGTRDWTAVDVPAHSSALGKVLLGHGVVDLPEGDLEQLTPYTITDREALRRELAQAVRRGWASTADELEIGLSGIAAPVRGSGGEVVAALGISGPSPRLQDRREEIGRKLSDRAEQLSGLLRRNTRKEGVA
jgi:DNA-binding IclR family transcriptional regulator